VGDGIPHFVAGSQACFLVVARVCWVTAAFRLSITSVFGTPPK
jgi:hypothetical protein